MRKSIEDVPALEFLSNEVNKVIHGHLTSNPKGLRIRTHSEDHGGINYGFDFDHINENNEDIFGINNLSQGGSRSPESISDEEEKEEAELFSAEPTKWTPDDATNMCELCHSVFTWYRWRHHCRMCGKLVCNNCSKYKDYVVGYSDNRVRVCKECYLAKESLKKKANQATSIYSGNFNPKKLQSIRINQKGTI